MGTIGFSYFDWKGVFYPSGLNPSRYLKYYSQYFNSVEIDSTFYGIPSKETIKNWVNNVPDGFRLCLKAPRQVTHNPAQNFIGYDLDKFLNTVQILKNHLGALLFQFPPSFKPMNVRKLIELINYIPEEFRIAVEIRNQTWYTGSDSEKGNPLVDLLSSNNVCWVSSEYPNLPAKILPTTNFLYIRWIGTLGSFEKFDREQINVTKRIEWWVEKISNSKKMVKEIYGFCSNDFAGFSPGTVNRIKEIIGLQSISFQLPKQMTLF